MNRKQYIEYRQIGLLTPIAYHYMLETSNLRLDFEFFKKCFQIYVTNNRIDVQSIIGYFDSKFEIILIEDLKTKKIIKIL